MKRAKSIEALIRKSKENLENLKNAYQESLQAKIINESLKIDIKNIFENLRSCLDYLGYEVSENYCNHIKQPKKLYFPIRDSREDFISAISKDYPGLETNSKPVLDLLETLQPYNDPWLGEFNQLNNANKHQDLVEQTRTESRRVTVSGSGGGSVSWGQGVRFGGGVSVMGVPIDPRTQLPVPNRRVKTDIAIWVDFKFRENGKSVLPFVEKSIDSVEQFYIKLSKHI